MYIAYPLVVSRYVAEKIVSKHGISVNDVENSIRTSDIYVRKGRGKDIYEILTRSPGGAYILVVLRKMYGTEYKLMTARPMKPAERKKYYENKRQG